MESSKREPRAQHSHHYRVLLHVRILSFSHDRPSSLANRTRSNRTNADQSKKLSVRFAETEDGSAMKSPTINDTISDLPASFSTLRMDRAVSLRPDLSSYRTSGSVRSFPPGVAEKVSKKPATLFVHIVDLNFLPRSSCRATTCRT